MRIHNGHGISVTGKQAEMRQQNPLVPDTVLAAQAVVTVTVKRRLGGQEHWAGVTGHFLGRILVPTP